MNAQVDEYMQQLTRWKNELTALREILLECGLQEEFKWKQPCYTFKGHNIVIIGPLKQHCVAGFFKGALLSDAENILNKPGSNTQAARSIQFSSLAEIKKLQTVFREYVFEAIEIERSGLKVDFKAKNELVYPDELLAKFKSVPHLEKAFTSLTPGKQRAYILHFSEAKREATRLNRIDKMIPLIMEGKGMHDEYVKKGKK